MAEGNYLEKEQPALTATGAGCSDQDTVLAVTQCQPELTGKGQGLGGGIEEGSKTGAASGDCLYILEV